MQHVRRKPHRPVVEWLESRRLFSFSVTNINITQMAGSQSEGAIASNPSNPAQLFEVNNIDIGDGLIAATSSDGGATWSHRLIASGTDGLPKACCDPSTAFDSSGNLFLAYLNSTDDTVVIALSTDAGQSFSKIKTISGSVDQPTIVTGPGAVWVMFQKDNRIVVANAVVTGPGTVGTFSPLKPAPGSGGGNFGDIAVGASGEVMVTYQKGGGHHQSKIFANVDPDGPGPAGFGRARVVSTTRVGGFDNIPAQLSRGVDAEASLAYDRSGGPFTGRAYLAYTDELPAASGNTDIFIRYSDDQGVTWSNPIRVNDDTGSNSQFLPRLAIDNTSGRVAIGWYDSRNDLGAGGPGDTNHIPNDDVQFFTTLITPVQDGLRVSPNLQISQGTSNAQAANNSIDLGDYTGLSFEAGVLHPAWADNSNSTGDNPDGARHALDMYTANVSASSFSNAPSISLGGLGEPSGAGAALYLQGDFARQVVGSARNYTFKVLYSDASAVSLASLNDGNILVIGPNGFSTGAHFVSAKNRRGSVLATYRVLPPDPNWRARDNGNYTLVLQDGQVLDANNQPAAGGILGNFVVAA